MAPQNTFERWFDRLRSQTWDRARAGTFSRFLWKRFIDDRLQPLADAAPATQAGTAEDTGGVVMHLIGAGLKAGGYGEIIGSDHSGREVLLDAVRRGRRRCPQEPCFELLAVGAVIHPITRRRDPLTGRNGRGVSE